MSPETRQALAADYLAGLTQRQLSRRYGIPRSTIARNLAGVHRPVPAVVRVAAIAAECRLMRAGALALLRLGLVEAAKTLLADGYWPTLAEARAMERR